MHRTLASAGVVLVTLSLVTACAPEGPGDSTLETSAAPSPSPSPTPDDPGRFVLALDGITFEGGAQSVTAGYDDAAALLALLRDATGESPAPVDLESPPGYEMDRVAYDWDGLRVVADADETGYASVVLTAAEVDGIPAATEEGLTVGSTRSELVAAQGWDQWDEDGDGVADYLGLGGREVPGTVSLTHPGQVGIDFLLFAVDDETITQIQAPSNDYADL